MYRWEIFLSFVYFIVFYSLIYSFLFQSYFWFWFLLSSNSELSNLIFLFFFGLLRITKVMQLIFHGWFAIFCTLFVISPSDLILGISLGLNFQNWLCFESMDLNFSPLCSANCLILHQTIEKGEYLWFIASEWIELVSHNISSISTYLL